ncbi:MAG: hypothetical protein IKN59_02365 [Paludibacteraceae bacterium]|nr:hypothetical protein [Paludibacteraceae bacterium]
MRKIFLLLAFICFIVANAQDYKIEGNEIIFSKIIENTGKSVSEMHTSLEAFFALRYNNVNSTNMLNQEDHLIYKGLFADIHTFPLGWIIDVPHTLDISIKENRLRIKVIISEGSCHNSSNANSYTYLITNHSPIGNRNTKLLKVDAIKAFETTCTRVNALFLDIENSLANNMVEDDW